MPDLAGLSRMPAKKRHHSSVSSESAEITCESDVSLATKRQVCCSINDILFNFFTLCLYSAWFPPRRAVSTKFQKQRTRVQHARRLMERMNLRVLTKGNITELNSILAKAKTAPALRIAHLTAAQIEMNHLDPPNLEITLPIGFYRTPGRVHLSLTIHPTTTYRPLESHPIVPPFQLPPCHHIILRIVFMLLLRTNTLQAHHLSDCVMYDQRILNPDTVLYRLIRFSILGWQVLKGFHFTHRHKKVLRW